MLSRSPLLHHDACPWLSPMADSLIAEYLPPYKGLIQSTCAKDHTFFNCPWGFVFWARTQRNLNRSSIQPKRKVEGVKDDSAFTYTTLPMSLDPSLKISILTGVSSQHPLISRVNISCSQTGLFPISAMTQIQHRHNEIWLSVSSLNKNPRIWNFQFLRASLIWDHELRT